MRIIQELYKAIHTESADNVALMLLDPKFQAIAYETLSISALEALLPECDVMRDKEIIMEYLMPHDLPIDFNEIHLSPLHYAMMKNGDIAMVLMNCYNSLDDVAQPQEPVAKIAKLSASAYAKHHSYINEPDIFGTTTLHLASAFGYEKIVSYFLENGYDINLDLPDVNGNTPLHRACQNNHIGIATSLIAHGANIDALDNYGRSPFFVSSYYEHKDISQLLIDNHADVNIVDDYSRTETDLAGDDDTI